jgi:hypothetical protein
MAEVQSGNTTSRDDTLRFVDMVSLFGTQAMMGLGKLANPSTGKVEKALPVARLFIDTLEMLERKTAGNLSVEEAKLLKATLTDLRLMYAEEASAPAPQAESAPPAEDESKTKFHKKYE